MVAKKAELEDAHNRYRRACELVARSEAARAFQDAVNEAVTCLPLIRPSMAYRRRFLKIDAPAAPTIDRLLRYAPPLFLRSALDAAEEWYTGGTRTEKNAIPDLPARLADARRQLAEATELWSLLAAEPRAKLALDGRAPAATALMAVWLELGAVAETRLLNLTEYVRVSDPRRPTRGKCTECGRVLAVPLTRLLGPYPCPGCRRDCPFVIVGRLE